MDEKEKYISIRIDDSYYETLPIEKYENRQVWQPNNKKHLTSNIPGEVIDILVKVKDKVKAGETVILIEAMKMNNMLSFSIDGIVKKIHIKKGDKVKKNHLLIELK